MALVEKFHVVAAMQKVDPNSLEIKEGMCVAMNGASGVRRVTTGDAKKVYGIAGDTFSTSAAAMPGIDKTAIVGNGAKASWQGRVSDSFDETRASGKITVYNSGGEFATDQFVDTNMDAAHVGYYLKADESTGKLTIDGATKTADSIAMLTLAAGAYASGVPGVDVSPNNDIALKGDNSNRYIEFKLLV